MSNRPDSGAAATAPAAPGAQDQAGSAAVAVAPTRRLEDLRRRRRWPALVLTGLVLAGLAAVALSLYWSRQPVRFDVAAQTRTELAAIGGNPVPGTTVVATTIGVAETLLDKPGGFLHNDRLPPGSLLDNGPSWECGALMALRDVVQALRNDFSRAQSQSAEDLDLRQADLKLAIDPKSWALPAAEDEYRQAVAALRAYLADLAANPAAAHFYPRADNLAAYLALVEKRLGNFGVRLSGSIADPDLTGVIAPLAGASESGSAAATGAVGRTPPDEIDHVFYCARGYSWAFLHLMQAVAVDFGPVLADKNADEPVQQIIRDLRAAVKPMRSPWVLNGHGYGLLANHSLVIGSYISRANAAVIDLRLVLQQG